MEEKLNLSVILPIKSAVVKDFDEFFDKAIKSLKLQKIAFNELLIVHTSEEQLVNKLQSYDFESLNVKLIEHKEEPNYQSQVNLGIEKCDTEWFSILEIDDEYKSIWLKSTKVSFFF